jgi:ABC-2 type transport system permease protein
LVRESGQLRHQGFRRFSTYRQATVAGLVTNIMFGFLRCYVLLAVAAVSPKVAGYDAAQLVGYVWAGQGLLGVVMLWGWTDLSDRIRSGDVVTDLLRPIHPGRQLPRGRYGPRRPRHDFPVLPGHGGGAMFFDIYLPHEAISYPLFLVSTVLAVMICFFCRYLVNATAFWLLDIRGVNLAWLIMSGLMGGLYFPIRFLPDWIAALLWFCTPGPSLFQAPMDILVERDAVPIRFGIVGVQIIWALLLWWACHAVQRRAERKMVIQGG